MALVSCPECGHQISIEARTCPNCGYKNEIKIKENSTLSIIGLGFGIFGLFPWAVGYGNFFILCIVGLIIAIIDIPVNLKYKHTCDIFTIVFFVLRVWMQLTI